jgi:nickel transport protein
VVTGAAGFGTETVRFMYSTGEEMAYTLVRVYAPSKPAVEILQSITDRNGYYSFVPDEEGEWRITAEDDMGHKGEIKLIAGSSGEAVTAAGGGTGGVPMTFRVLTGLSLILNIFAAYHFVLGRKPQAPIPEEKPKKGGAHAY